MKNVLVIALIMFLALLTAGLCALSAVLFLNNRDLKKEVEDLKGKIEQQDNSNDDKNNSDNTSDDTNNDGCEQGSDDANVAIFTPCDGDKVGDVLTVSGLARAFENTIVVEVTDETGKSFYKQSILTDATEAGILGNYSLDIDPSELPDGNMYVKVYILSAKDGSEESLVKVHVLR